MRVKAINKRERKKETVHTYKQNRKKGSKTGKERLMLRTNADILDKNHLDQTRVLVCFINQTLPSVVNIGSTESKGKISLDVSLEAADNCVLASSILIGPSFRGALVQMGSTPLQL